MQKKTKKYILIAVCVALAILLPLSCEVMLGALLNLDGPVVKISSPVQESDQANLSVSAIFILEGTAESRVEIPRMEITVDYYNPADKSLTRLGREWHYENNTWKYRDDSDKNWVSFTLSEINNILSSIDGIDGSEARAAEWQRSDYTVYWSLPILLHRMQTGDYFITVSAWDSTGLHDSNSSATLKVYYNSREPQFDIISPVSPILLTGKMDGTGSMANPDVPDALLNYTYNPIYEPDSTYGDIGKWITDKPFNLNWRINDSASEPLELTLEITNRHNLETGEGKKVYYSYGPAVVSRSGTMPITIPQEDLPNDTATPMQIVTRLKDGSGNVQYKSQGFFGYLPDAEIPWTNIRFGYMDDPKKQAPLTAPETYYMFKGASHTGILAYSRHALAFMEWTIYKLQDDSLDWDGIGKWTNERITFGPNANSWDFSVWSEFGTGRFRIEVTVTDNEGNSGTSSAYFSIESNATPTVKNLATYLEEGRTLLGVDVGDTSHKGDFIISGIAQIENSADTNPANRLAWVDRVSIVWIKPGTQEVVANNRLLYTDRTYGNWNGATPGSYRDYGTSRVWELAPGDITFVLGTEGNNNGNEMEDWKFTKTLNLFDDLNMGREPGKNAFNGQDFLIRLESNVKGKASVRSFTTGGDVSAPEIRITKVYALNIAGDDPGEKNYSWPVEPMLSPQLKEGDSVWLEGTWNDNSLQAWTGLSDAALLRLFSQMQITWSGDSLKQALELTEFTIDRGGGISGKWKTKPLIFPNDNTDPNVNITIELEDLGNNRGRFYESMLIETDNPGLSNISSTASDGKYGGKEFDPMNEGYLPLFITLTFNGTVDFRPGLDSNTLASLPWLELNNGGRAFYYDGVNSARYTFVYFIDGVSWFGNSYNGFGGTSTPRLTVNSIGNTGGISPWVRSNGSTQAIIPESVFGTNENSLASKNKIEIDKIPPKIDRITSTTSDSFAHGVGSTININVIFDENIEFDEKKQDLTKMYLTLTGLSGNPDARAYFTNISAPMSASFLYTVPQGHNSTSATTYLGVRSIFFDDIIIEDEAGNKFDNPSNLGTLGTLRNSLGANANLSVDTNPPERPTIGGTGITAGTTLYTDISFTINGLDPNVSSVEYSVNGGSSWLAATQPVVNNSMTITPTLVNGPYTITARQYDNARPKNVSPNAVNVGTVTLDKGNLLERITATNSDGIYPTSVPGSDVITIRLVFRKAVHLRGTPTTYPSLTLNSGGTANLVTSQVGNFKTTWDFTYSIGATDTTNGGNLNVSSINLGTAQFYDANTGGTLVNAYMTQFPSGNNLNNLKSIQILTGNPAISNKTLGSDVVFSTSPASLRVTFNRPIYQGDTENKVVIRQVATNYRMPAVLSISEWNALFVNRTDIGTLNTTTGIVSNNLTASRWEDIGNFLYEKGNNGANSSFVSDTSVKYVLKYEVDPTSTDGGNNIAGTGYSMAQLNGYLIEAEALRFGTKDAEVTIVNNANNTGTLTFALSGTKALPVRGATYMVTFPYGFVKDSQGRHNGGVTTGNETNMPTNLAYTGVGVDPPDIRVNKSHDDGFAGTEATRQLKQPLQADVRISSRTPGASISYRLRNTTDPVNQLIWRDATTNSTINNEGFSLRLPYLGHQHFWNGPGGNRSYPQPSRDFASFNRTKNRPQSGYNGTTFTDSYVYWYPESGETPNNPSPGGNLLNYWQGMSTTWPNGETYTSYTNNTKIGLLDYNLGGMQYNIEARASVTGQTPSYAWETAYRSVLVFVNANNINGNNNETNVGAIFGTNGKGGNGNYARIWVRGGDTGMGDTSTPGFPISRNPSQGDKARLLTPIAVNRFTSRNDNVIAEDAIVTTGYLPAGNYVWFWVTWSLNVNAYIDLFAADLPSAATGNQYPQYQKNYYDGYMADKEHFPVIPGRTTVLETRDVYDYQVDGRHWNLKFSEDIIKLPYTTP